jgi:putative Mg2+ transporter-C (MgtC) family protein
VLTGVILVILRLVSTNLPQQSVVDAAVIWRREAVEAEAAVEAVLEGVDRARRADRFELIDGGEAVRRTFRLKLGDETELKALAARLRAIEGVTGYVLDPRDD